MASPKMILQIAIGKHKKEESVAEESGEPCIKELVERVFTTRNLVHFAHLMSNSFAKHIALGELYDSIVDAVDEIAEVYSGEFGKLTDLKCDCCVVPDDITKYIKDEFSWIKQNRNKIANGSTVIENLLDGLSALYSKALYKLENLH